MGEHTDDELAAAKTAGFNVGEKKTLEEYQKLGKIVQSVAPRESSFRG